MKLIDWDFLKCDFRGTGFNSIVIVKAEVAPGVVKYAWFFTADADKKTDSEITLILTHREFEWTLERHSASKLLDQYREANGQ